MLERESEPLAPSVDVAKHVEGTDSDPPPVYQTQAERVVAKFGGVRRLLRLFEEAGRPISASTIYRWLYPRGKSSGCGGRIPSRMMPEVILIAREDGMILTSEDLDPRPLLVRPPRKYRRGVCD